MDVKNELFAFYSSWLVNIKEEYADNLNLQKDLVFAVVNYGIFGEKKFPAEKLFLKQTYDQIDIAREKSKKRSEAGKKGGAPVGNKNASKEEKQAKTSKNKQNNPNVNKHVNVNENKHLHVNVNNTSSSDACLNGGTDSDAANEDWFDRL